jgi:FkbM family methyltransferase
MWFNVWLDVVNAIVGFAIQEFLSVKAAFAIIPNPVRCHRNMKNDLIFDLGMHLGEDTNFYLKKGYKVVAVEANPDNVEFCRARFAQEIAKRRLHIVSGAIVSNRNEGFIIFYQTVKSNWGTIEKDWANRNLGRGNPSVEIKVPIVDLQRLFSQYGIPYYIKIDLQGQELTVISLLKSLPNIPQYASLNLGV